ncbi:sphingomyelin phosphodiesterase 4, neutral membrane (neutral sphingomyelinase-3) [Dissophora ornata]|nr:sphingomyelin phosphodiesterase 4, neutral membrane (neutral sphingomyelinase-3) [Dissophora ornata]
MSFEGLDRLLVGSVQTACANLNNHLSQCFDSDVHAKTFFEFLPRLCQILFGSKESRGWMHLPLSKAEEDPLYDLIRPRGVLMRFLLSRYTDNGFIYEMVPDSLPKRTQSKLDPTQYLTLPPIYLSRVNLVKTTAPVGTQKTMTQITKVNLNFNMLEYFLFYFAYALTLDDDDVNGRGMRRTDPKLAFRISGPAPGTATAGAARPADWATGSAPKAPVARVLVDGSFFNLFQQYLHYFIPAPDRPKDAPSEANAVQRQPLNIFNDQSIENSADRTQTQLSISEFFIGTLVELWLGQNDKTVDNRTIRYVQPGADIADCVSALISHLYAHDISPYALGGDLVPSHIVDSTGKSVLNLAGMARRSAYQYIRPQLYTFLQAGLRFWPLDDTFPSLVDTWMIWITPWRYGRRDPSVTGDEVSAKWQVSKAVLECLEASSRPMAVPAPLTLNKELRSIQKVMRVFKTLNLKEILKIVEQAIVYPENFSDSSYAAFEALSEGGLGGSGSVRPDSTTAFLGSMVNALQRQLQQLEGLHFKYEALFLVEGPGRSKIRMLLTKLGNAVDVRQEKLATMEAKTKQASEQMAGLSAISSAFNSMFSQPPPKTASIDPGIYTREVKALRDIMALVGEVFDLYPNVVAGFEKQHQGTQDRGSALTAEQLEALIPPLEDVESTGLLGPEQQRKYVPRGLVRASINDVKGSGPRAQDLVLTYESEYLVKLTRQAEEYLTPKWQSVVKGVNGWISLPRKVVSSRVHLRWLASIPNLSALAMVGLAILSFYMLSAYLSSLGQSGPQQRRLQEPHISRKALEDDSSVLGRYDAHVQPVYRWEKPGQTSVAPQGGQVARGRVSSRTATAEPRYTIDLQGI